MKNDARLLPELKSGAKVLFIRLRSLGDTILSTPLFTALKTWRPDLQLAVLVETPYNQVLFQNPDLFSVFHLPVDNTKQRSSLWARWQILKKVRQERFDCCINLHGGSTSAWLTLMSGACHRVGLHSFRNSFCYNVRLRLPTASPGIHWHSVRHQIEWLHQLGLPVAPIPPSRIVPDVRLKSKVQNRLKQAGVSSTQSYCVIHPSCRFYTKEWTDSGFAEITDYIQDRHDYVTLLVGTLSEESKIRRVTRLCRTQPATIFGLTISELMWVLSRAKLFIGNDSGPTHLAAALGVPTLALFGSSDSRVWHPWQVTYEIVQNPFECNPCPGYRCLVYDEPRCILSITPAQVKEGVERLLDRAGLTVVRS